MRFLQCWIESPTVCQTGMYSPGRFGAANGDHFREWELGLAEATIQTMRSYCPKCGSEDVLDYTNSDSPTANQAQMFCVDCHTIGSKEQFSNKPHFWNWRFWRVKPIPLLLTIGISLCIHASGKVRATVFIVIYALLCSITPRRRNGQRVFPAYMW